jgi:hypothetical protein
MCKLRLLEAGSRQLGGPAEGAAGAGAMAGSGGAAAVSPCVHSARLQTLLLLKPSLSAVLQAGQTGIWDFSSWAQHAFSGTAEDTATHQLSAQSVLCHTAPEPGSVTSWHQ